MMFPFTLAAIATSLLYVWSAWSTLGAVSLILVPVVGSVAYLLAALLHCAVTPDTDRHDDGIRDLTGQPETD